MKKGIFLFGSFLLLFSLTVQARSINHRFEITEGDSRSPIFDITKVNQAHVSFQWLLLEDVPSSIKNVVLGESDISSQSVVFLVRSHFLLTQPMEKFSSTYFSNRKVLKSMSGMEHKDTSLKNVFRVKYKPVPIVSVRSTGRVLFPDEFSAHGLFLNQDDAAVYVDLSYFDFSDYIHQMNTLWSFSEFQEYTRVEMLSLVILQTTERKGFAWGAMKDTLEQRLEVQIKRTVKTFED